jgi:hypothetical protein
LESPTQADLVQHGKIISSWVEFIYAMRKKFYPLAYNQTYIIEWLHLKQLKGKNVQDYTQEFIHDFLYTRNKLVNRHTNNNNIITTYQPVKYIP